MNQCSVNQASFCYCPNPQLWCLAKKMATETDKRILPVVVKEGFLLKRGILKSWKSKYFLLNRHTLVYFQREQHIVEGSLKTQLNPQGRVFLSDLVKVKSGGDAGEKKACQFTLHTKKHRIKLQASSIAERDSWRDAILKQWMLESEGETLELEEQALESEGQTLESEGQALELEGHELELEGQELELEGQELELEGQELELKGQALEFEGQALESEEKTLVSEGQALEPEGETLESGKILKSGVPESTESHRRSLNALPPGQSVGCNLVCVCLEHL